MADSEDFAVFTQRFLGHAPTSIAERHYVSDRAGQAKFDRAVEWGGNQDRVFVLTALCPRWHAPPASAL